MDGMVQQMVTNQLMQVAKTVEDQLDEQLHALDNLDDDDLERIRQRRIDAMKAHQQKKKRWLEQGHGEYSNINDEKAFFKEMKGEEKMVVHFYRENWPCKVMDKHLQQLASKHLECKFARIDAEKSPFLTEKLKIWMLPTLALIKNEKVVDYVVGFDDLGGTDDFKHVLKIHEARPELGRGAGYQAEFRRPEQEHLVMVLGAHGVINPEDGAAMPKPKPVQERKVRSTITRDSSGEDSDFD